MSKSSRLTTDLTTSPLPEEQGCLHKEVAVAAFVACASGPIFKVHVGPDGNPLPFPVAHPNAPNWVMKIARYLGQS